MATGLGGEARLSSPVKAGKGGIPGTPRTEAVRSTSTMLAGGQFCGSRCAPSSTFQAQREKEGQASSTTRTVF